MNEKVTIIAEAGVNHNGSIELAKKLIEVAAKAGADFVKFQTFKTENLVSKAAPKAAYQIENTGKAAESQFEMIKKLELDWQAHETLIAHANQHRIKFLSTAFDLDSIDLLEQLNIPFYKIPSGEITNLPYIEKIAKIGKPVVVSTGMCNLGDIEAALAVLISNGVNREKITVLHCNTQYPTPLEDVNLLAMNTIKSAFDVKVGYSDHTLGIEVPIAAVAMGATCIEKHFTLDKSMEGPDHKSSLNPEELVAMVAGIRKIEQALGSPIKQSSPSEKQNKVIARKSIHLKKGVRKGTVLTLEHLIMKRPGDGISPMRLSEVIGKTLNSDKKIDAKLSLSDLI